MLRGLVKANSDLTGSEKIRSWKAGVNSELKKPSFASF